MCSASLVLAAYFARTHFSALTNATLSRYLSPEFLASMQELPDRHVVVSSTSEYSFAQAKVMSSYDGQKLDVYSCGVLIFYCLTGVLPFWHADTPIQSLDHDSYNFSAEAQVLQWRRLKAEVLDFGTPVGFSPRGPPNARWDKARRGPISDEARSFVERALERDPGRRWTAEALLAHPWLRGRVAEFMKVFGDEWLGAGGAEACAAAAAAAAGPPAVGGGGAPGGMEEEGAGGARA